MKSIIELKKDLFVGDYGECICDYESGYIDDIISEIADNRTSIYYSDIKEFIVNNFDAVEDVISEFGWEGCGSDLYKAGQLAEFMKIQEDIHSNIEDIMKLYALHYLESNYDAVLLEDDLTELIEGISYYDYTRLEDISADMDTFMEKCHEEDC